MRFKMKLLPALVALAVSVTGCGGGSGSNQSGSTVNATVSLNAQLACVDLNHNWQCDDGDATRTSSGAFSVAPKAGEYVLLESRDANNQRTRLLVSQAGSDSVTAVSTLRTMLATSGKTAAEIAAVEAALQSAHGSALESLLADGYANTMSSYPLALAALSAYSNAVAAQATAKPALASYAPTLGDSSTDVTWASSEADSTRRHLSVQGSTVLNNSESNRLYLFDAAATTVSSREIDLVPAAAPVLASYPLLVRRTVAALDKVLSVFVDTASAATAFANPPTGGTPLVLEPGKGIAGIELVDGGKSAYVLFNMLAGSYQRSDCAGSTDGNEGLFKISLSDSASYRALQQAPACVHSGFSLIAADAAGGRVAAWDAVSKQMWVIDGATMQKLFSIDLKFDADKPPQALALTPGGRYLAAAGYGRLSIVDMASGRLVTQLDGDWGNVAQIGFGGGGRRIMLASGSRMHTFMLDDGLKLIAQSAATVSAGDETLRTVAVAPDGDSYLAASDSKVYWRATSNGAALGTVSLPSGLAVQRATLAGKYLVVLARNNEDKQFKLLRLPVGLPVLPTDSTH